MPSAVVSYTASTTENIEVGLRETGVLSIMTEYYDETTADETTPGGVIDEVSATYLRTDAGGTPVDVK